MQYTFTLLIPDLTALWQKCLILQCFISYLCKCNITCNTKVLTHKSTQVTEERNTERVHKRYNFRHTQSANWNRLWALAISGCAKLKRISQKACFLFSLITKCWMWVTICWQCNQKCEDFSVGWVFLFFWFSLKYNITWSREKWKWTCLLAFIMNAWCI